MNITFYQFVKRENSTAQPGAGVTSKTYDCRLKEDTSIIEPSILIVKEAAQSYTDLLSYNYAYIADFGRYYFVRNVISVSNVLVEFILEVDALSSFKTDIGNANEYVFRSASSYDGDIVDSLYPTKGNTDLVIGDFTATAPFVPANTTYILGIVNNISSNKFGAVQYYAMTGGEIGDLMNYLLGVPDENAGIGSLISSVIAPMTNPDLQQAVSRSILDPASYIVESYMLPYKPPVASSGQQVHAGWFNIPGAYGDILSSSSSEFFITSGTLDLPDHPQKNDRGPYLNLGPFMKYWLYLGPFGIYPLDPVTVYNNRTVTFSIDGDLLGNITCKLFVDSKQIDTLHANVKCNFPVAQTTMDVSRAVGAGVNIAQSAGKVIAGDPAGIISGISGITSAADSILPQMRSQGTQGSFVNVWDQFYSYAEEHWVIDDDNVHRGRPLCKSVQISTLSGYILVSDPDIAISGTAEENTRIKSYMANGFFYE